MELKRLSLEEYKKIFSNPYQVFNGADFNSMNSKARDIQIQCLGFKSKKYKLGIIGGILDGKFLSPFSAPFGSFSFAQEDVSLGAIDEAIDLFLEYCRSSSFAEVNMTFPPLFYNSSFISKLSNALYRKQFVLSRNDLNYSIHLNQTVQHYLNNLHYNARKNLNIALTKNFEFFQCQSLAEKEVAYDIIKRNRESKGYPLRMAFDTIKKTIEIIGADFFLVRLNNEAVAAAMIFHVSEGIVQVVYWGDLQEYGANKPMNYLSYNVVNHYYNTNIKVIDIGPSTENSIPNYGLCDFKESIGCKVFPKYSFKIDLN